jgi:hypothetical protein
MTRYAERTEVSSDRSRAEIEKTLRRYGASQFAYGWDRTGAVIGFTMEGRQVRFVLPLPDPADAEFTRTPTGRSRSGSAADTEYERAVRQRWRALSLVVKAKLEAVAAGIAIFEDEFLAYTVLPGGETVGQRVGPAVAEAYRTGQVPALLPSYDRPAIESGPGR